MSELLVGLVTEGPTDYEVLTWVIRSAILADREVRFLPLQPERSPSFGESGTGWKGVRRYCQTQIAELGLAQFLALTRPPLDLLVIHLDADVAHDGEVERARDCPPARDTTILLERLVLEWLDSEPERASRTVVATPSKATETWIVYGQVKELEVAVPAGLDECVLEPYKLLLRQPFKVEGLRRGRSKSTRIYGDKLAPETARHWDFICHECSEASRFSSEILAAVR